MKLPEPARSVWRRHREAVDALRTEGNKAGRLMLGGGTILAARWKHRVSTDIDVLLPDREALNDAQPNGSNDLAAATGGRIAEAWRDRLKVRVEKGMLDVCAAAPQLPGLEKKAEVEGREETVLANAQILRGKLNRTHKGVTRDAFDLVSAANADPGALQQAVNALGRKEWLTVCHNLIQANDKMKDEANEVLEGISAGFETDLDRLGYNAAKAVTENRYTHVRIRIADEAVVIEKNRGTGEPRDERYAKAGGDEALTASGIGEYLSTNTTAGRRTVGDAIDQLRERQWEGVVFDSEDRRPSERIEQALESTRKPVRPGGDPKMGAPPTRQGATGKAKREAERQATERSEEDGSYKR